MKFRPILFSTPMVQAILNGTKTQTRRVVKPQPMKHHWQIFDHYKINAPLLNTTKGIGVQFSHSIKNNHERDNFVLAKANKDDIFWVRETWALDYFGKGQYWHFKEGIDVNKSDIVYKASSDDLTVTLDKKWKPSIFMPKQVCRLFLKCTNVRVERLHDISDGDAKAEGIEIGDGFEQFKNYQKGYPWKNSAIESFFSLWESINGKESLDSNPWTWAYDFEIIEKPENFI